MKAEPTPCWGSVAFTEATVSWASLASLVVPLNIRHSPISRENLQASKHIRRNTMFLMFFQATYICRQHDCRTSASERPRRLRCVLGAQDREDFVRTGSNIDPMAFFALLGGLPQDGCQETCLGSFCSSHVGASKRRVPFVYSKHTKYLQL